MTHDPNHDIDPVADRYAHREGHYEPVAGAAQGREAEKKMKDPVLIDVTTALPSSHIEDLDYPIGAVFVIPSGHFEGTASGDTTYPMVSIQSADHLNELSALWAEFFSRAAGMKYRPVAKRFGNLGWMYIHLNPIPQSTGSSTYYDDIILTDRDA